MKEAFLRADDENIFLTHQEVERVLLIFLHHSPHEKLASKQVGGHEGAVLCHSNFIRAELDPVCRQTGAHTRAHDF